MDCANKLYGKRLRDLRVKKKFTQEFIANSLDIRTATISEFENGKISIKLSTLGSICQILGISIIEFFDFDSLPTDAKKTEIIAAISANLKALDIEKLLYINTMTQMFKKR